MSHNYPRAPCNYRVQQSHISVQIRRVVFTLFCEIAPLATVQLECKALLRVVHEYYNMRIVSLLFVRTARRATRGHMAIGYCYIPVLILLRCIVAIGGDDGGNTCAVGTTPTKHINLHIICGIVLSGVRRSSE